MDVAFDRALDALMRLPTSSCADRFGALFPVAGTSISTLGGVLGSETLSASDDVAARLDELQFDLGEGPCWDALASARPVLTPDFSTASSWPLFSAAAPREKVGALFAFPMVVGAVPVGAVDMYSPDRGPLSAEHVTQASALADALARRILSEAVGGLGDEAGAVETRYSRRVVHQATGMVLAQLDISADDARQLIHSRAFSTGRSVIDVSSDIVAGRLDLAADSEPSGGEADG